MKKLYIAPIAIAGVVVSVLLGGCSATTTYSFVVDIEDGWTSTSTPIIAHITDQSSYDVYYAIEADNKESSSIDLTRGTYSIDYINPINADGSAYRLTNVETSTENGNTTINLSSEYVSSNDVTIDDINSIYEKIDAIPTDDSGISEEYKNDIKSKLQAVIDSKSQSNE